MNEIEPSVKQRQIRRIVTWMNTHGGITQQDAYQIGITRLSGRIFDMKQLGYQICDKWEHGLNQYNEKCKWKRYFMEGME